MIIDFQEYFANRYDGTNTDGMERLSDWDGNTYNTYGLPHYEVPCVSTSSNLMYAIFPPLTCIETYWHENL